MIHMNAFDIPGWSPREQDGMDVLPFVRGVVLQAFGGLAITSLLLTITGAIICSTELKAWRSGAEPSPSQSVKVVKVFKQTGALY